MTIEKNKIILNSAQRTIDNQFATRNNIQINASKVLTFTSIFVPILLSIIDGKITGCNKHLVLIPLTTGVIAISLLLIAIWPKRFNIDLSSKDLIRFYEDKSTQDEVLKDRVNALISAVENNESTLIDLKRLLAWSFSLSLITFILFVSLILFSNSLV